MAIEINSSTSAKAVASTLKATSSKVLTDNIINGFGGEDQITMPGDSVDRVVIRGDDMVFYTKRGYKFRINNVKGHYIELHDDEGAHYKHYGGAYTYRPIDVIQSFMASLDKTKLQGSKALDEAIDACSDKFSTLKEAIAQCVADCKSAGDANTFLRKYCGIELSDTDTGAITGWDAANPDTKSNEDVVPETGSMKTFSGTSFTVNGLTLNVPSNLTSAQSSTGSIRGGRRKGSTSSRNPTATITVSRRRVRRPSRRWTSNLKPARIIIWRSCATLTTPNPARRSS